MTGSYNPATNTLSIVFTPVEEKVFVYIRNKYGANYLIDFFRRWIVSKTEEMKDDLLRTDPEIVALLLAKGVVL